MSDSEASASRRNSYSSDSFHSDDPSFKNHKNNNARQTRSFPGRRNKLPPSQAGSTRNLSRNSATTGTHTVANNAARRMLSAGRVKINELQNKLTELNVQLANVQAENKQLLRQQRQQERLLAQYERQESEAPTVVQRMGEESHALREQLRRLREKYDAKNRKLRDVSEELDRTQRLLKKMKTLVDDRKLSERDELTQKLKQANEKAEEQEQTINDLKRHIENLMKNHKHELGIERARHRETQRKLEALQELDNKRQMQLREKEKELEVRNIYALRQQRPPHRLDSSVTSTPLHMSDSRYLPQRAKLQSIHNGAMEKELSSESLQDRNFDSRDHSGRRLSYDMNEHASNRMLSAEMSKQLENEQRLLARLQEEEQEKSKLSMERERFKQEQFERKQLEKDRLRREQQEQKEHERLEKERAEKDRMELERRNREQAEHEKREEEERERLAQEEAERLRNSVEEQERLRQKEILLARMKAIDEGKHDETVAVSNGAVTRGKPPVHTDNGLGEGAVFGDYRPSFLVGTTAPVKSGKKVKEKKMEPPKNDILLFDEPSNTTNEQKSLSPDLSFLKGSEVNAKEVGAGDNPGNHLLPRRPRQQAATMSTAAGIGFVNDSDDDIEEVIL